MQANRGLVQHITHTLQIAAQLRRQTDALCLTTAKRGRATVQRQITQPHFFQKFETALNLWHQVARNVALARGHATNHLQRLHPLAHIGHTQTRDVGDADCVELHGPRRGVKACALARGAGRIHQVFNIGLGKGLLAAFVVVVFHRIVEHLALVTGQGYAGAYAIGAPTMLAVVAKQPRVQLHIGGGAHRAGALGREHLHPADTGCGCAVQHGLLEAVHAGQHMHHALAMHQSSSQCLAQTRFVGRVYIQAGYGQLDVVFLESVDAREVGGGQKVAIHPQMREPTWPRPVSQLGVNTLAGGHQRRQQADVLTSEIL